MPQPDVEFLVKGRTSIFGDNHVSCIVSLSNNLDVAVRVFRIVVYNKSRQVGISRHFGVGPHSSNVNEISLRQGGRCDDEGSFFVVDYSADDGRRGSALALSTPYVKQDGIEGLQTLVTSIGSVLATLVGALAFHIFTLSRDKETARKEAARGRFSRLEPPYRKFLGGWGKSLDATILHDQIIILEDTVVQEGDTRAKIVEAYNRLSERGRPTVERRAIAEELDAYLRDYLLSLEKTLR